MCFSKLIRKGALHLEPKVATRPIKVIKIGSKFYRIGSICEKISDKNTFASDIFPRLYIKNELCTQKLEPEEMAQLESLKFQQELFIIPIMYILYLIQ